LPAFVQNRCYAHLGWDRAVRHFCRQHKIVYQGFSLLTANQEVLRHPRIASLAAQAEATPAQAVFASPAPSEFSRSPALPTPATCSRT